MFGYVKPFVPELKVKENEFYRAAYCGLCRALGRKSRFLSFTLSYDFVFLAVVDMAITENSGIELGKERCIAHPLRKRAYIKSNRSLDRTSSAAAILLYYDLLDDINDSKGIKRLFSKACLPKAARLRKKYMGDGVTDCAAKEKLSALSEIEKRGAESIYQPAEIFGELLGEIFRASVESGDEDAAGKGVCMYSLGRHIGRWIYIIDALDDIEKDEKSGSYNYFVASGQYKEEDFRRLIGEALTFELIEASKAVDLLGITDSGLLDIINNILTCGMPKEADAVISGKNKSSKRTTKRGVDSIE